MSKICQVCGSENNDAEFFCQNCGTEISLSAHPARSSAPPGQAEGAAGPAKMRVCPKCGQANDAVFALCANCGFDLSGAAAVPAGGGRLFLIVSGERFECRDGDVLGRDGTVARSFFAAIGTVSRRHVTVRSREGRWFLTVSSGVQNITQLDGRELGRDLEQELSGEHVLKLSTQCEVRLKVEQGGM